MAIKTVNADNLAEFVASHPTKATDTTVTETKVDDKSGVVAEGGESIKTGPDPGKQPSEEEKKAQAKKSGGVQERIDELTRKRKEAEEGWEEEYETRIRLEAELEALKASKAEPQKEPEKAFGTDGPDPTKYTDQKEFLRDYANWVKKETRDEITREQAVAEATKRFKEAEDEFFKKVSRAKADLPDYEDVIRLGQRRRNNEDLPPHIKAFLYESEYGAHVGYDLLKDSDLEKRILALSPIKAVRELAKLEEAHTPKPKEAAAPVTPETKNPPEPISRLGEGSGVVVTNSRDARDFHEYKRLRNEERRARR